MRNCINLKLTAPNKHRSKRNGYEKQPLSVLRRFFELADLSFSKESYKNCADSFEL